MVKIMTEKMKTMKDTMVNCIKSNEKTIVAIFIALILGIGIGFLVPRSTETVMPQISADSPAPIPASIPELPSVTKISTSNIVVKGPYFLSEGSAEDIMRNEREVKAVIWYADTEEINITAEDPDDDLRYVTYHTSIPLNKWDELVSILKQEKINFLSNSTNTEPSIKRDYVFPDEEYARFLFINEKALGLQMLIWHEIPDLEAINITVADGNYRTDIPRGEWERIEKLILLSK